MEKDKNLPRSVPSQKRGAKTDAETVKELKNTQQAVELFEKAKQRMLSVNSWKELCGPGSASFQLVDANGKEVSREAKVNDYMRVDLPGPGTKSGDGYDWVKIELLDEVGSSRDEYQSFSMRVRPVQSPYSKEDEVAHFYTDSATSTFTIQRDGTRVIAGEHGRNEITNTDTSSVLDNVRNKIVGSSAMAGISEIQWKSLANGLLED